MQTGGPGTEVVILVHDKMAADASNDFSPERAMQELSALLELADKGDIKELMNDEGRLNEMIRDLAEVIRAIHPWKRSDLYPNLIR